MRTTIEEVRNELTKHRNLFALFDEDSGAVQTFIAPNPDIARQTALPSVDELETERSHILATIDRAGRAERSKLKGRLDVLERDLQRARAAAEVERTNADRERERASERGAPGTTAPPPAPTPSINLASIRESLEALSRRVAALAGKPNFMAQQSRARRCSDHWEVVKPTTATNATKKFFAYMPGRTL